MLVTFYYSCLSQSISLIIDVRSLSFRNLSRFRMSVENCGKRCNCQWWTMERINTIVAVVHSNRIPKKNLYVLCPAKKTASSQRLSSASRLKLMISSSHNAYSISWRTAADTSWIQLHKLHSTNRDSVGQYCAPIFSPRSPQVLCAHSLPALGPHKNENNDSSSQVANIGH